MKSPPPDDPAPERLASLFKLGDGSAAGAPLWQPNEFAALWRHQLSAPVAGEMGPVLDVRTGRVGASEEARHDPESPRGRPAPVPPHITFGELLRHQRPPLGLLDGVRTFGKSAGRGPTASLPPEVGDALYFAAIAAAFLRCGERLTSLNDQALRRGLDWSARQDWIDPSTRDLFTEASARLAGGTAAAPDG